MEFKLVRDDGVTISADLTRAVAGERGELVFILGRDPDEANLLIEEAEISRKQARLSIEEGQFILENLSDSSPTQVNGHALDGPVLLTPEDSIDMGGRSYHIQLHTETEGEEAPHVDLAESQQAEVEAEEQGQPTIFAPSQEPGLQLHADTRFVAKILAGPNSGAEFSLEPGKLVRIGTGSNCDIVVNDISVSREHASLEISEEGEVHLNDLGSRNGVLVDGEAISGEAILHAGNQIALGTTLLVVIDKDAAQETFVPVAAVFKKKEAPKVEEKPVEVPKEPRKRFLSPAMWLMLVVLALLSWGAFELFKPTTPIANKHNYEQQISAIVNKVDYPNVTYNYTEVNQTLILWGRVASPVDKERLRAKLDALNLPKAWSESLAIDSQILITVNETLSQTAAWKGIQMVLNEKGGFVLQGFIETEENYTALLTKVSQVFTTYTFEDKVFVAEKVRKTFRDKLYAKKIFTVDASFSLRKMSFFGTLSIDQQEAFDAIYKLAEEWVQQGKLSDVSRDDVQVLPEGPARENLTQYFKVLGYSEIKTGTQVEAIVTLVQTATANAQSVIVRAGDALEVQVPGSPVEKLYVQKIQQRADDAQNPRAKEIVLVGKGKREYFIEFDVP